MFAITRAYILRRDVVRDFLGIPRVSTIVALRYLPKPVAFQVAEPLELESTVQSQVHRDIEHVPVPAVKTTGIAAVDATQHTVKPLQ